MTDLSSSSALSDSSESQSDADAETEVSSEECTPEKRIQSLRSYSRAGLFNIESAHFIWCSEYVRDILGTLKEVEKKRKRNAFKSPQLNFRPSLIKLIKYAAESQYLSRTTVHLAVYFLDIFMDSYKIVANKLNLVALVCVLLAAKMEERDHNIPKMMRLNALVDNQFTKQEFKCVEIKILCNLDWNMLCPTAATYVECFAGRMLTLEDVNSINKELDNIASSRKNITSYNHLFSTINGLIFELLDLSLQDARLTHIDPSILAASCLAASRQLCGVNPVWPKRLRIMTGYEIDVLSEFVDALIVLRESQLPKSDDTPDSGFISDSSSVSSDDCYEDPRPRKRCKISV